MKTLVARQSQTNTHTRVLAHTLRKTMTSVAQRMNASREARKRQGGHAPHVPRTFSPLTPVIQRMYSNPDEVCPKLEPTMSACTQSVSMYFVFVTCFEACMYIYAKSV